MRRAIVKALNAVCLAVDEIAYRPIVVRLGLWFPRWWNCQLARLSMRLDERWQTSYWDDGPAEPGEPCMACGRRASIFEVEVWRDDQLVGNVELCGWCRLPDDVGENLEAALKSAGKESVGFRWR